MMRRTALLVLAIAGISGVVLGTKTVAQSGLKINYGANGIQQLSYAGVTLEDLDAYPADAFHIWHMKATDLSGNVLTSGQYGWGESNNGRQWNASTQSWTYNFSWGSIAVQFAQSGDTLNMIVTTTNLANSGVIFDGATIYPLALHFPTLPSGFMNASYPQMTFNTTAPSVTAADYGSGEVVAVVPDASKPLYSGFLPTSPTNAYVPFISSTTPDSLATFLPHNDRPVAPGQTDTFTVSLRFAASGTSAASLASDAYASWASTWPAQLNWQDRRIIGTMYLSSSPTGSDPTQPGGFPTNPRRYFNDSGVDVTTPSGLVTFQKRILQQAAANVTNMQRLNAQGGITWDIEGEQFPQSTSYVCAPDQIAQVSPEMETVINDSTSPYNGLKLDDAYFKTMTDAGLRVGVCIRPQHFTLGAGGTASQVYLPDAQIVSELVRKMKYAHDRWGATIFYLDSTVEPDGGTLDASLLQQAAAALPDSLLIPEESTPKFYAYTAPFQTFLFHGDLGTDPSVYGYYPKAFSANLINDVDPAKLAQATAQLTASVQRGDILMVHADYWQANNATVMQIYQSAGAKTGSSTATTTPPVTGGSGSGSGATSGGGSSTTNGGSSTTSGGSSGTTGGSATAPTSGGASGSTGTTPPVVVTPVTTTPVVTAPVTNPAPSSQVTILSPAASQTVSGSIVVMGEVDVTLDAAGSHLMVDGNTVPHTQVGSAPYAYSLDTTTLPDGTHTLQLWAHDTGNDTVLSSAVVVTVANGSASSASSSSAGTASTSSGTGGSTSSSTSGAPGTSTSSSGSSSTGSSGSGTSGSGSAATSTAPPATSTAPAPSAPTTAGSTQASTSPVSLTFPTSGQSVTGLIAVAASINDGLDSQGSYLMVDGVQVGSGRVTNAPFLYNLDTSTLSSGTHTLQIWAHDLNNNVLLSNIAQITVPQP